MAKKLGFTYTLSVDEKQSTTNLKQSIKNIQQKNSNLSVPVNLKLNTTIPREMMTAANEALKKKNLSLSVGLKINPKSITNATISEAQKVLDDKNKKLAMTVGLKIDEKALKKMETLNNAFKEMKNTTEDIVNNVQKLAGVKLQIFEGVDGNGNSTRTKSKASNMSDLQTEIDYQQTSLQIMMNKLKVQKEYNTMLSDSTIENRINSLQEYINTLGNEARNVSEVREQARLLKQELESIKAHGKTVVFDENEKKKAQELNKEIQKQQEILQARYRSMSQSKQINALIGEEKEAWEQVGIAIKNLDGKNIAEVKEQARQLGLQMTNLKTDGVVRLNSVWTDLKKTLITIPSTYMSAFAVINSLNSLIRDSISYTKELDEAYTDVAVSMDITREKFDDWTKEARQIAQSNGLMTTSLMEMVKIYATAGEEIEDIQDKLAGTAMIQNITQWDAEQTTSAVNSVVSQYRLLEKEINGTTGNVANAIEYMGDALVGISNELKVDNVAGIQEMINAIDTAGGIMEQSGASMEWYMAVAGTLKETMNATGDEVGNAFKMISARVFAQAQAMEELGESTENIEIEARKAEEALNSVNISVREASDPSQLRDLEEIMDELYGKWGKLSEATKQYVAEGVAGTNRRNYFVTMMENYERVTTLANAGLESQGALAEANAVRVESLASKINIFQDKLMSLLDGMTPFLKTTLDIGSAILDLIKGFGVFSSTVSGLSMAFFNFNSSGKAMRDTLLSLVGTKSSFVSKTLEEKEAMMSSIETSRINIATLQKKIAQKQMYGKSIDSTVAKLKMEQASLKATQIQLVATTLKTVALQAAMSMGLSLAIGAVISLAGKLVSSLSQAASSVSNLTQSFGDMKKNHDSLSSSVATLSNLRDEYAKLKSTMDSSTYGSEEYKEAEQGLLGVQKEIADNYPSLISYIDEEGNAYATNLDAIDKYTESQKKLLDIQKDAMVTSAKANKPKLESELSDLESQNKQYQNQLEEYSSMIAELESKMANSSNPIYKAFAQQDINLLINEQNKLIEKINETSSSIQSTTETLIGYEDILGQTTKTSDSLASASNDLSNSLFNFQEDSEKVVKSQKELNEEYMKSVEELVEAEELLKSIKENADYDAISAFANSGLIEDYNGSLSDTASIQEYLNDKIREMQEASDEAYYEMNRQDEDFWNNKIKNTDSWIQYQKDAQDELTQYLADTMGIQYEDFRNYINEKGGLRDVDVSNAKNLADAELTVNQGLNGQLLKLFGSFVNDKGSARITDMDNIVEFLNLQETKEADTIYRLAQLWAEYYNKKKAELNTTLKMLDKTNTAATMSASELEKMNATLSASGLKMPTNHYNSIYGQATQLKEDVQKAKQELEELNVENSEFNKLLDKLSSYSGKSSNTLKQNTVGSGSLGNKLSSTAGSSSSKKESSEKTVENLDLEIDRYYKLSDAIDDLNNKLAMNQALQNNAKDYNTRKKLMEEEIKLMEEKIKALENLNNEQRNELLDNKNVLSTYGFTFDGEGNLQNYASQLKKLQDDANRLSGDAKEAAIEQVKWINEVIESYTTLSNNTMPDTEVAIEELRYQIEKLNKEHEKELEKIEKLGNRYFELEQAISKVDNALALNQAKQENATANERVALMEEEIALIKQKQKLVAQQKNETKEEANELKSSLSNKGVKFNDDGSISNYQQIIDNMKASANLLAGEYRDDAVEEIEELIAKMEEYSELVNGTIPELETEWEEYTNTLKEAELAKAELVASIEKNITSAITNEYQKRTEALKTELQKQKDAYNKQFDEEDWEDSLSEEQRKLDEIQQQINNLSRDTSLAGQLKLQQLLEDYQDQQKVIDDMIRDHEKEQGNNRFDEEMEKLDQELEDTLSTENLAAMVNQALINGFVTIGDEVIELNSLMTSWLDETGDGLTAMGNSLKEELIGNLEVAKQLLAEVGIVTSKVGGRSISGTIDTSQTIGEVSMNDVVSRLNAFMSSTNGASPTVQIESLLRVDGNITEDVLPEVRRMIENAKEELIDNIAAEILTR